MQFALLVITALALGQTEPLGPGDHKRAITVDGSKRTCRIHVPATYDPKKPSAVILALHGAVTDAEIMERFSGLSKTADEYNFVVVYPNALLFTWNAGLSNKNNTSDDVKYLGKLLDDLEGVLNVDKKRVYMVGLSNGGMMTYRAAGEMSERIAAIASVAGTMPDAKFEPKRPISVLHFHGTKDTLVPFNGPNAKNDSFGIMKFRSVNDTVMSCVKANGCSETPVVTEMAMKQDKVKVLRQEYGKGKDGSEVVLYVIEGGGHTWPGSTLSPPFLGLSTNNISANEIMWEFFKKHPLK